MARPNITMLKRPPRRFRPSVRSARFETATKVRTEDAMRARRLYKAALKAESRWGRLAAELARRLDPALNPQPQPTLASARYKSRLRDNIAGHITRLIETGPYRRRVSNFTIIKRRWTFHVETLLDVDTDPTHPTFNQFIGPTVTVI